MGNGKRNYAPSAKLWESRNGGSYTSFITESSFEKIKEVFERAEIGGMVLVKPVSEAYKSKAGKNAPAFEITVLTADEVAAFSQKNSPSVGL